ncbi:MAG: hypothetical protein J7J43_01350 [Thermosipho sp. (in: Bacteria)]|nr:hypothetical protein [Thermosipho sp. (in: thermotogales)]
MQSRIKVEYKINGNKIEITTIRRAAHVFTPFLGINCYIVFARYTARMDNGFLYIVQ